MKHLLLTACILFSSLAFAQKQTPKPAASPIETYKKVYAMALQNGDANAAINSLYLIIAVEGNNSPYKDSLAFLYFDMASYAQCERVAQQIVNDNADSLAKGQKLTMLEILALSQASLSKVKEAIISFEKLLSKTNEMYHAYRLAELQYAYKRVGEATQTILFAETLKNSMQAPVKIEVAKGQLQEVKLEAAIQNLKGYIYLEEFPDKKQEAIAAFNKALELEPDFILAKNNLAFATSKEKPEQKPADKK